MLPRSMHPTMARLRALFDEGLLLSQHDVSARLYVDPRNAREYLKILHGDEVIRIGEWRRDSPHGKPTPVFVKRQPGEMDAPKPTAQTVAQAKAKSRKSTAQCEAEARVKRIARAAARFRREGGVRVADPLMAAFNRDAMLPRL
jgi:predicted ArsR family transcriptional regulator